MQEEVTLGEHEFDIIDVSVDILVLRYLGYGIDSQKAREEQNRLKPKVPNMK